MTVRVLLPEHIRAARGLLNWTQADLADQAGLASTTIKRLEKQGTEKASLENINKIISALEDAGIELLNDGRPGARLARARSSS